MLSIDPVERLSRTNTSSPRSSSASARWDPTNPAPPVISTRINRSSSKLRSVPRGTPARRSSASARRTAAALRSAARPSEPDGKSRQEVPPSCAQLLPKLLIIQNPARAIPAGSPFARPAMIPASTKGDRLLGSPITSAGTPRTAASSATVELTVTTARLAARSGAAAPTDPSTRTRGRPAVAAV